MFQATKFRNVVIAVAVLAILLSALTFYLLPSLSKSDTTQVSSLPTHVSNTSAKSTASTPSASISPIVHVFIQGNYPDGDDGYFYPVTVTVVIGLNNTVSWMNNGRVVHTATDAPFFDSGDIKPGQSWQYTFTKPGTYPYFCIYHAQMFGTVIVKNQST